MPEVIGTSKSISGFDPRSVPGCLLWFDADDTSTITGTSTVTSWVNKGSNGGYASNYSGSCTSGNTYKGRNFIECPSGTELRFTTALNTQERSWFVVARVVSILNSSTPLYAGIINQTAGSGQDSVSTGYIDNANNYLGNGPSGVSAGVVTNNAPPSVMNSVFMTSIVNSVNTSLNVLTLNGVSLTPNGGSTSATAYNTSTLTYTIGTAVYSSTVDVMEVLFYAGAVTPIQRQQIEGYLAWKWKLQTNITSTIPTSISGCQLWLDAADTSTYMVGSITTCSDKSGNGNTATNTGSVTASVKAINGLNAFSFTGGYLYGTVNNSRATATVFCVLKPDLASWPANGRVWSFGIPGTDDWNDVRNLNLARYGSSNGAVVTRPGIGNMPPNAPGVPLTASPAIVTIRFDGSYGYAYLNGALCQSPIASTSNFGYTNYSVGSGTGNETGNTFYGLIGELIEYTTPITYDQQAQIENYLSYKWNIPSSTVELPYSHPFFLTRPFTRPFSPQDVPGCYVWFDGADISTITTSGGTVTAWNDKTSNAWAATTLIGSAPSTTTVNGLNAVSFPGSSTLTVSNFITIGQARSVFFVFNTSGSGNYITGFDGRNSSTSSYGAWNQFYANGGELALYAHTTGGDTSILQALPSGGPISTGTPAIISLVQSAASTSSNFIGINGNTQSLTYSQLATTYPAGTSNYYIGNAFGIQATICEYIQYVGEVTSSQRQQIEGYLAWKWGLKSYFPSSHAFYSFPSSSVLPFLPTNIEQCSLWLDASREVGTNGTSITSLADRSGNGNNGAPVSGNVITLATGYQNGMSVYDFQGYRAAIPNFTWTINFTVFIVAKTVSGGFLISQQPSSYYNYVNTGNWNLIYINSGFGVNDAIIAQGTPVVATGQFFLFCIGYQSGSSNVVNYSVNGTVRTSASGSSQASMTVTQPQTLYINGNSGGAFDSSQVAELIFYTGVLTDSQRQQVEGYLAQKWKI